MQSVRWLVHRPRTEKGRERRAEAKTLRGRETRRKIRVESSRKSVELHWSLNLGNTVRLFELKTLAQKEAAKMTISIQSNLTVDF